MNTTLDSTTNPKDSNPSAAIVAGPGFDPDDLELRERRHGHWVVQNLFNAAAAHGLKYPKIRLMTTDGSIVVLRKAGKKSRFCGLITMTDDERYPLSQFYGHFGGIGGFPCFTASATDTVRVLLVKFIKKPLQVIFECGALSGNCAFCNARLSDARSTAHGYGPICAKNFELPWDANRKFRGWQQNEIRQQRETYEQHSVAPRTA